MTGDKRKKEWCLVYKDHYALRVGTWRVMDKCRERIPYPCRSDYRVLHISVCKNMLFSGGVDYFRESND